MTAPLHEFSDLERLLRELPAPPEGFARVYRGQTADFPAMLPSACRPGAPSTGELWKIALAGLRDRSLRMDPDAPGIDMIMNMGFWFDVLAQHYGPGSPYLDVTSAPEVALWFALNRAHTEGPQAEFYADQPGLGPVPIKCSIMSFEEHADEPGWLYVLDVPRWDGERLPGHGELVDLAEGPPFVANCPRVSRQQGALIQGKADVGGGDLSSFYACPPIAVAREFRGAAFVDRDAHYLFPSPDEDEWYGRLLQAPLVPQPGTDTALEYQQSLGIYVVTPGGTSDEALAVLERQKARMSMLTRAFLRAAPELRKALREDVGTDPETATYVQLHVPLLRPLPPASHWNPSALMTGLGRRTRPRVGGSGEPLPAVSLDEVLIELSPLDSAFVDVEPGGMLAKAIWLVRRGDTFHVTVFAHSPETGAILCNDPAEIRFSPSQGVFELRTEDGSVPLLEAPLPSDVVKAFFVALDVLRGLGDSLKPDAFVSMSTTADGGEQQVDLVGVRGQSTLLVRAKSDPADLRLHFLRDAGSLERYRGPAPERVQALLKLQSTHGFAAFRSLRDLYGHVLELTEAGADPHGLPERTSDGFSAEIADFLLGLFPPDAMR